MPHAHLTVSHLLKQLETRRERKLARDRRPGWLTAVIDAAADLFDPVAELGRVGFDCRPTETGWIAILYLGSEETVGGPDDGQTRLADFRFDARRAMALFDRVDELLLDAFPSLAETEDADAGDAKAIAAGVRLTIRGEVAGHPLTLHVHAVPPDSAGPGFRRFPNGQREVSE